VSGEYSELKLTWLDRYLPYALNATRTKLDRAYIDLFAGPGRSIFGPDHQRQESESGALRALCTRGPGPNGAGFTSAYLVNLDPAHHAALEERICRIPDAALAIPRSAIHCVLADANICLPTLLGSIPTRGYAFVFVDPENAGQFPWTTVEALLSQGHQSIDLYLLFPWGMDLRRQLPWGPLTAENERSQSEFYGCEAWREIAACYQTDAFRNERSRDMRALYLARLRSRWAYALEVQAVPRRGEQNLYYMLFASSNEAGRRIAEGVVKAIRKSAEQTSLF